MSSTKEKRLLTAPNSRLGKVDLAAMLRKEGAWSVLPLEARQRIYDLLPAPSADEPAHDVEVNPLQTRYRPYIEEELRRWQEDLVDGRETKKWRDEAREAGRARMRGEYDDFLAMEREKYFGDGKGEEDDSESGIAAEDKDEDTSMRG